MAENTTVAERVLDALVVAGLLTTEQLATARGNAETSGGSPGELLLERGAFSESDIERVLEEELGIPSVDLSSYAPDEAALKLVPASLAREHDVLPLFEIEGTLTLAVGSPRDVFRIDEIGVRTGLEIEIVRSSGASVREAIEQCYSTEIAPSAVVAYTEFPESAAWDRPAPGGEEPYPTPAEEVAEDLELEQQSGTEEIPPVAEDREAPGSADDLREELLVEEPTEEPAEEPINEPTEEPAEEPINEPTEEPVEESIVEPAPESAEEPVPEPIEEPVTEPVAIPDIEPVPASAIDLDVLAVADPGRVAVLVTDILDLALHRGASQIHVLPYKEEFFVVLRVNGRLEQVGHAPRSLERALVDGFKTYANLAPVAPGAPALGRAHVDTAGRAVMLTLSAVPTITGQRLVVSISTERSVPMVLDELGLTAAEEQVLAALVERGRGLLMVASPVGGGSSTTYAALIAHASAAGRTVYSVERALGYEIPSVAQVIAGPGSPGSAASYLDAGLHQDTDVVALDFARDAEEIELAIQAAASAKLAIVAVPASDAASAIRRVLDLGVEPEGLARTLALVVAQRLARTVCPTCAVLQTSSLAARIPGADAETIAPVGTGCDACAQTGFGGVTALFEVLPAQPSVRAAIAHNEPRDELAAIAEAAGMKPMIAAGLARVREGLVSAEELDLVLRFSE